MNISTPLGFRVRTVLTIGSALVMVAALSGAQTPIVQPGAPGNPSRLITAEEASDLAAISYTDGDVKFMQGMISHHAQALEMTVLLEARTQRDVMRQLAQRIDISQEDEIAMMQGWLRERNLTVRMLSKRWDKLLLWRKQRWVPMKS